MAFTWQSRVVLLTMSAFWGACLFLLRICKAIDEVVSARWVSLLWSLEQYVLQKRGQRRSFWQIVLLCAWIMPLLWLFFWIEVSRGRVTLQMLLFAPCNQIGHAAVTRFATSKWLSLLVSDYWLHWIALIAGHDCSWCRWTLCLRTILVHAGNRLSLVKCCDDRSFCLAELVLHELGRAIRSAAVSPITYSSFVLHEAWDMRGSALLFLQLQTTLLWSLLTSLSLAWASRVSRALKTFIDVLSNGLRKIGSWPRFFTVVHWNLKIWNSTDRLTAHWK